jgi:hypothetical protein
VSTDWHAASRLPAAVSCLRVTCNKLQNLETDFARIARELPGLGYLDCSHCGDFFFGKLTAESPGSSLAKMRSLTNLNLSYCNQITDDGLKQTLAEMRSLTSLSLRGCHEITGTGLEPCKDMDKLRYLDLEYCQKVTDDGLKVLARVHSLTDLNLSGLQEITGSSLATCTGMDQLTTLNLHTCCRITDVNLADFLRNKTRLTGLILENCFCSSIETITAIAGLSKLESLDLSGQENLDDNNLKSLATELTSLTSLAINYCDNVTAEGLKDLKPIRSLTSLHLGGCKALTATCTQVVSRNWPALRHLELYCIYKLDENWTAPIGRMASLTSLSLAGSDNLTDVGVSKIVHLKALTGLDLSLCPKLTDTDVVSLAALTSLTSLDLSRCPKVTAKGVVALCKALTSLPYPNTESCGFDSGKCRERVRLARSRLKK